MRCGFASGGPSPKWSRLLILRLLAATSCSLRAATNELAASPQGLKQMSIEALMNLEVTSVSRRPEPLWTTASAIQLVTGEDIRRSGATSIPEALRLAANLQLAHVDSRQWSLNARGLNNRLTNRLLVRSDGR